MDVRVRLRPQDGAPARRDHGALRGHPARARDVRDVRAGVVDADGRGRSGRAVLQRHHEVRRLRHADRADVRNSQVVGPYDPATIRRLKEELDGDLYVSSSARLVRAMLADGLVDELDLFVYPLTLGAGQRLFPEGDPPLKFGLARSEVYENGVVHLAYSA